MSMHPSIDEPPASWPPLRHRRRPLRRSSHVPATSGRGRAHPALGACVTLVRTAEGHSRGRADPKGDVGTQILTVEDDERIRTAVRLALEDEGWDVVEARSGEEALDLFKRSNADVVLIDIMLPGIDGFEVCRSIRRSSDVPS